MKRNFQPVQEDDCISSSSAEEKVDPMQITNWHIPRYREKRTVHDEDFNTYCDFVTQKYTKSKRKIRRKYGCKCGNVDYDDIQVLFENNNIKKFKRCVQNWCKEYDDYTECTIFRRSPSQLKENALVREEFLKRRNELREDIIKKQKFDAKVCSKDTRFPKEEKPLVQFVSCPSLTGKRVKVKPASPSCSIELVYLPTHRVLDLKGKRNAILINEIAICGDTSIPFSTYNPRVLQARADERSALTLIERPDGCYVNIDRKPPELPRSRQEQINDCLEDKMRLFEIPLDLNRTFKALVVCGFDAIRKEPPSYKDSPVVVAEKRRRPKEVAAIYLAFARILVKHISKWSYADVDDILDKGRKLVQESEDCCYKNKCQPFDIVPNLRKYNVAVRLDLHSQGYINSVQGENIYKDLFYFFKTSETCLFISEDVYLLIRKFNHEYLVFDANGRDARYRRKLCSGKACMAKTKPIEHVVHIIVNLSQLKSTAMYNIYDLRLVDFGVISDPVTTTCKPKRHPFVIVNQFYSIISGTCGIEHPKTVNDKNPSLVTSLLGIVYQALEPGKHWRRTVIDNLIRYGTLFERKYSKMNNLENTNIRNLPKDIAIGCYVANIEIYPFKYAGHVTKMVDYLNSNIIQALENAFKCYKYTLVQFDTVVLAVWKADDLFYVFDPFLRDPVGRKIPKGGEEAYCCGAGVLQMHLNYRSLARLFYQNAVTFTISGNFFIHTIEINSVFVLTASKYGSRRKGFSRNFPLYCLAKSPSCGDLSPEYCRLKDLKKVPSMIPPQCLSKLSIKPCQRACSEKDVYKRLNQEARDRARIEHLNHIDSMVSIDFQIHSINPYGPEDVVLPVLREIICNIIQDCTENSEEKDDSSSKDNAAQKVLLKSDKLHLEGIKQAIEHNKYGEAVNLIDNKPREKEITLAEELKLPTNYTLLPDGIWILLGEKEQSYCEKYDKFYAVMNAIVAAVSTKKYRISTWNTAILDYILELREQLRNCYSSDESVLPMLIKRQVPDIQFGRKLFQTEIVKIYEGRVSSLQCILECVLKNYDCLLLTFENFTCMIRSRHNFMYLFIGHPCDIMGFRVRNGNICVLRFIDLPNLVRRIDYNRLNSDPYQHFVLFSVHVKDRSTGKDGKFIQPAESYEQLRYDSELNMQSTLKKIYDTKMEFIEGEIAREKGRIKQFRKIKAQYIKNKGKQDTAKKCVPGEEGEECYENNEEEEEDDKQEAGEDYEEPFKKQVADIRLSEKDLYEDIERPKYRTGYRLRAGECLFKLQGSTALESRSGGSPRNIRACYYASIYALLSAISIPIPKWNYLRVDQVIAKANELYNCFRDKCISCERRINNLSIDEYVVSVVVRQWRTKKPKPIKLALRHLLRERKHILIQILNTTFALYMDKYYHLFDPYHSLETLGKSAKTDGIKNKKQQKKVENKGGPEQTDEQEEYYEEFCEEEYEDQDAKKSRACTATCKDYNNVPSFPDCNTASWVLFPKLCQVLKYIGERAQNNRWQCEYNLHIIDICSYKKGPKSAKIYHNLVAPQSEPTLIPKENILDLKPEKLCWIHQSSQIPIWSRLNKKTASGDPRGTLLAMDKSWDIELPDTLYSLWGCVHPLSNTFNNSRGKQYLAISVMACAMVSVYRITEWNQEILDSIFIHGDKYFKESTENISTKNYEFTLEDLNLSYKNINHLHIDIIIRIILAGNLYNTTERFKMNLSSALSYFFSNYRFGVIQCMSRCLSFGRGNRGYFMFDCQSYGHPLFNDGEGCSYVLRTETLEKLLEVIIVTLNIPYNNAEFIIHRVEISTTKNSNR